MDAEFWSAYERYPALRGLATTNELDEAARILDGLSESERVAAVAYFEREGSWGGDWRAGLDRALRRHRGEVVPWVPRPVRDVVWAPIWPSQGILPDPDRNVRYQAIAEVLCRIPEDDFAALNERAETFQWFIPHEWELGMVYPFRVTHEERSGEGESERTVREAHVLYLDSHLERRAWSVVLAVVAHELAHLALAHSLQPRDYHAQEEAAWAKVAAWGFGSESKKHAAMDRRRATRQARLIARLMEASC